MESSNSTVPTISLSPPVISTTENISKMDLSKDSLEQTVQNEGLQVKMPVPVIKKPKTFDTDTTNNIDPLHSVAAKDKSKLNATSASKLCVPIPSSSNSKQINSLPIGSATGNPRNKTALRPGYSLMDWIRLTKKEGSNLSGRGGRYMDVTTAELSNHSTRNDAWMAINGLVFNVTGNNFDFNSISGFCNKKSLKRPPPPTE